MRHAKDLAKAARDKARQDRDARRRRLGPGVYHAMLKQISETVRLAFEAGAISSIWGLEGPLRHELRSVLCLGGWGWAEADLTARELLEDVYRNVKAERPSWREGQADWAMEAGTLIERMCCVRCRKPLPEGRFKFCGNLCKSVYHGGLSKLKAASEDAAVKMVIRRI